MLLDDLQTTRKVSITLLLIVIQLIIITTFGGGWISIPNSWISALVTIWTPTLIPFPSGAVWWMQTTAILMYINLTISVLYILWTIGLIVVPDRIPLNLKMTVFVDMIVSGVLALFLTIAYAFFAGGFNSSTPNSIITLGYCFWLTVISSIVSFANLLIAGLSWFRN